jgi:hypothetical protein
MASGSSVELSNALETLKDAPDVDTWLARCPDPAVADDPVVRLLFPRFREDAPDLQDFADWLWRNAINYAIPLRKRREAQLKAQSSPSGADLSALARLYDDTKRAFLEFNKKYPHRAGEVGELIAYLVVLHHLNAPQIASKMALKTNTNMPVHGLDGVHARFENGVMTLYFLESKLAKSVNDGAEAYVKSTAEFSAGKKQYLVEYEILSDLGNLQALPDAERALAMEYFDVYGPKKSQRLERSVGVISYTEKIHYSNKIPKSNSSPPSAHEAHFMNLLDGDRAKHVACLKKHMTSKGVSSSSCEVFLIAFPDIDGLRELFQEHTK